MKARAWWAAGCLLLVAGAAVGQTAPDPAVGDIVTAQADTQPVGTAPAGAASAGTAAPATTNELPEVEVTAQRRTQQLQDVPVAVSVFSGAQLEQTQSGNTLELTRLVPNTISNNNTGQGSANVYFIRGLGQTQSFVSFEPQVGTYVNDIYISRQNANNFALFDVQDVQVLRGPQGTLFGRNNTGGAILVTLTPPKDAFSGYADVGYGDRNRVIGRASVDIPITDELLTKSSAYVIHDDGYVRDITTNEELNHQHNYGLREAVRFAPDSPLNIIWDVSGDFSDDDNAVLLNFLDARHKRISFSGFPSDGNTIGLITGQKANYGQFSRVRSYGAASNFQIDLGPGTLNVISGYRGLRQQATLDFPDAQFGPITDDANKYGQFLLPIDADGNEYTQELKYVGHYGDALTYTVGTYYLYETSQESFGATLYSPAIVGLPITIPLGDETFRANTSSTAVYGQADYKPIEDLTVTVGIRYTSERKRISVVGNQPGGFDTADVQAAGYKTSLLTQLVTPRFALEYALDKDLSLYASATKGFQGGGWNGLAFSAPTFNNFGPEKVWSYEGGLHYRSPERTFRLNADVFYQNVVHYQLLSTSPVPGNFTTNNAADFEDYGLELDGAWEPVHNFTVSGSVGLQNGSYFNPILSVREQQIACHTGQETGNAALIAGNCNQGIVGTNGRLAQPEYLPHLTAAASLSYVFEGSYNGFGFTVTPTVGAQFASRQSLGTADNAIGIESSYALMDAQVVLALDKAKWSVIAECRNCTYADYGTNYLFGYKYLNDPGIWDFRFRYVF